MNKKYSLLAVLTFCYLIGFSQTSTFSPYSIFGLGDIEWNGTGKTRLIGGTGIALKSDGYLNVVNPASYSAIDSNTFILEASVLGTSSNYYYSDLDLRMNTTNFNSFALGFQATKWWASSFGLKPYSHTGYSITTENDLEGTTSSYYTVFEGSGDITQLYWGNSFSYKGLSLGANFSYVFGTIKKEEHIQLASLTDDEDIITRAMHVRNVFMDFGLQYTQSFEKWDHTIGLIYHPKQYLVCDETDSYYSSSMDSTRIEEKFGEANFWVPEKFGAGYSFYNKEKHLKLAVDYQFEKWSDIEYENITSNIKLTNLHRASIGFEIQPDPTDRSNYLKRINYMVGAYYVNSNLRYKSNQVTDFGFTLGAGLPVGEKTYIFVGGEVGHRGNLTGGLIQEDYYKFNLAFSLKDNWFTKSKYR